MVTSLTLKEKVLRSHDGNESRSFNAFFLFSFQTRIKRQQHSAVPLTAVGNQLWIYHGITEQTFIDPKLANAEKFVGGA